jgi:aldose 1-epimerase
MGGRGVPSIARESIGSTPTGQAVDRYTLTNPSGIVVKVITHGGIIQEILLPDHEGQPVNVVLGFSTPSASR